MNSPNRPPFVGNACYACARRENGEVTFRFCGACKSVKYCSKLCQRIHWKQTHKDWCGEATGLRPKCILDKYVTWEEGMEWNAGNLNKMMDYHAWCVDENNEVHDYPISQLAVGYEFKTDKVVRRPFDVNHVMKSLPEIMQILDCLVPYIEEVKPLSLDEKIEKIKNNTFPLNQCLPRAMALRDSNPRKFAVVIGSLGFVQSDGTIAWFHG